MKLSLSALHIKSLFRRFSDIQIIKIIVGKTE